MKYFINDSVGVQMRPYAVSEKRIIPALIAGGAMLAGTIANAVSNKSNQDEQARINKENMDFQREMFNRKSQREDMLNANSALIQRQSFEKAGLNPNVGSYSSLQTGVDQGSASSEAYKKQPFFNSEQAGPFIQAVQQQPLIDAQVKNIEADTQKKTVEAENVSVDTILKQTQNWALRQKTPAEVKNLEKNTELLNEEMNRVKWDEKQIEANIELIKSKQSNIDLDTSFLLDSYDTRLGQLTATVSELQSRNALNLANAAVAYKSIEVMSHQIREIESRVSLNQKEWLYLDTQITNLCIDGDFKTFQYNIEKKFGAAKAKLINDEINENILNTRSSMMWRPVGMMIGAVGAGAGVANVLK